MPIHKSGLFAILAVFALLGLLYDFNVPLFEKPDELKHFAVIQHIQTARRLPVVRAGVSRAWDQEGTQPPLYHLLAAALVSWLDLSNFEEPPRNPHYADDRSFFWRERGNNNLYLHPPGENWSGSPVILAARLSRWMSLLAGLLTLIFTYFLAQVVFVDDRGSSGPSRPVPYDTTTASQSLPLLAVALIAFIPQYLHVSAAISNDGLSVTLAAAGLLVLALILKRGGSLRYALYLGLILGLGALTKLSLLYLALPAGLVLLLDYRRHRSLQRLVTFGLVAGGLALLLAGWWYWRNWRLYGDVTALNAHLLYRGGPLDPRPTLAQIWQTELTGLELSFWAAFGAGQILLEPWLYTLLRSIKYLLLPGLLLGLWRSLTTARHPQHRTPNLPLVTHDTHTHQPPTTNHQPPTSHSPLSIILLLWPLLIFTALLRWMQITPASWGRLLYPALPALGLLAAWSLSHLRLPRLTSHASRITYYVSRLPLFLLPLALLILSLVSPFRYLQAAYAKTPLIPETAMPSEGIERLDITYDGAMRLLGYRLETESVRPGDWLPVTLYWQALRPLDTNYSAFVTLLDQTQTVVGQANTYPDGGNWPTSFLEPGLVLPDTYHVPISPEADAPALLRLAIGLFEFEEPARAAKIAVDPAGNVITPLVGAIPLRPHQWPELDPVQPVEADFAGQIQLGGYDWPAGTHVRPGTQVPITLYWQTLSPPGRDLVLFIHLVDPANGELVAGFDGPPDFPTAYWQTGDRIVDSRDLPLPPELPPGDYELWLGWYSLETLERLPLADPPGGDALRLRGVTVQP